MATATTQRDDQPKLTDAVRWYRIDPRRECVDGLGETIASKTTRYEFSLTVERFEQIADVFNEHLMRPHCGGATTPRAYQRENHGETKRT